MTTIPFPELEELVELGAGFSSSWVDGFFFPGGYVRELKERFPDVQFLHRALDREDQVLVESLLSAYLRKLSLITPGQVIRAAEEQKIDELVDRAHQAMEFGKFLNNLERCYFPERIRAREERQRRTAEDYG